MCLIITLFNSQTGLPAGAGQQHPVASIVQRLANPVNPVICYQVRNNGNDDQLFLKRVMVHGDNEGPGFAAPGIFKVKTS